MGLTEPPSSIELRLIDGDTGKSIDGAIVMGYWSKNPLPSLGCIPGAYSGFPFIALEYRSWWLPARLGPMKAVACSSPIPNGAAGSQPPRTGFKS